MPDHRTASSIDQAVSQLRPATCPNLTILLLALCDLATLIFAGMLAIALRSWANGIIDYDVYARLWAGAGLFTIAYASANLYPGVGTSAADELRRLTIATSLVYLALAASVFLAKESEEYSRGALLMGWMFSLFLVPLARGILRMACAARPWWGLPTVVLGSGDSASRVIASLRRNARLGLKAVAVLDDGEARLPALDGVPVAGGFQLAASLGRDLRIPYAIIALAQKSDEAQATLMRLIERYGKIFPHLVVIPDLFGSSLLWLSALDLGGMLGLEVKQRLMLPGPRRTKRLFDLLLTVGGGLLALPLLLLLGTLVRLTSRGPVFYTQTRVGQGGRLFKAWKFRSMIADADRVLASYLAQHPEQLAEWERDRKLRHDPRITWLGRFLRRSSLDELPQLWNVLRGDMSLIGPRPIVQDEVRFYTHRFHLYGKLKPGMTGLWQVSGRNDTTYAERVDFDSYYVRNWSIWLDLVILSRTSLVVFFGRGAY
jgi:Undecaprenyl-phosphate galactose phosphotransferase WbaP